MEKYLPLVRTIKEHEQHQIEEIEKMLLLSYIRERNNEGDTVRLALPPPR